MDAIPFFTGSSSSVPQIGSTYEQRFIDAVRVLCGGSVPPAEFVVEWLANVEVEGMARLQDWVLTQDAPLPWAQGIAVLDAAAVLANQPEEGCEHELLDDSTEPAAVDDRPAYDELAAAMRDMEAAFEEARVTASPWGGLRSRFRSLLARIPG